MKKPGLSQTEHKLLQQTLLVMSNDLCREAVKLKMLYSKNSPPSGIVAVLDAITRAQTALADARMALESHFYREYPEHRGPLLAAENS